MKEKKKYAPKKTRRRILKIGAVAGAVIVSVILIFYVLFPPFQRYYPDPKKFYFNAVIVDQLSLTAPNQTFVQTATSILQDGGFTVDYVRGKDVTVDYYKNTLTSHNYGVVVLRTHSAPTEIRDNKTVQQGNIFIFTAENYSTQKYVWEQLNDEINSVAYSPEGPRYFGITPKFKMNGNFENTIIVMMGCGGLDMGFATNLAEMFIYRGAKTYFGWSNAVTASHTDNSIQKLLHYMVTERKPLGIALGYIQSDSSTGASLIQYPHGDDVNFVIPQKSPTTNFTPTRTEINTADASTSVELSSKNKSSYSPNPTSQPQERFV